MTVTRTAAGLVLVGLAAAVILGVMTSLLQTYGVRTDLFSLNRAPGGTLGNRNFIAHLAAFGLPVIMLLTLQAGRRARYAGGALGVAVVVAVLVLTRSRAAWLAFAGAVLTFLLAMIISPQLRRSGRTWARLLGGIVAAAIAVSLAVFAPNALNWNSEHPYLQSMKDVTNFQEGSGQGRLIQYTRSLRMAPAHGLLGVGPGNWAVKYPKYAAHQDPSLNHSEPGTTANPWPSSDWVTYVSERGVVTTALLLLVFFAIAMHGLRQLVRAQTLNDAIAGAALIATLIAANIAGAFDAVMLLAVPTLLVWAALGALYSPVETSGRPARASALLVLAFVALVGAVRSGAQLYGMSVYAKHSSSVHALETAARIDPGNYDLHMRLARSGAKRAIRCQHARAAHDLYPSAAAARNASASCPKD